MKHPVIRTLSAAVASLFLAAPSFAHVGYNNALFIQAGGVDPIGTAGTAGNVYGADTFGAASNFNTTLSSNAGYITGLDPVSYGNSHDMKFRYFVLTQQSQVSFTIAGLANSTVTGNANPALNGITPDTLNPAFSLYTGIVPPSSHDGVGDTPAYAADPDVNALLQSSPGFAPWSPFSGTNSAIDTANGQAAGTAAANGTRWGAFRTNADVTMGNNGVSPGGSTYSYMFANGDNSPTVGTMYYTGISVADALAGATWTDSQGNVSGVLGADGVVDNMVSWSGILGPGVYTLAIGGANPDDYAAYFDDVRDSMGGLGSDTAANNAYGADRLARKFSISGFTVTAVPEASTWGMMIAGLGLVGMATRRRRKPARIW